MANKYYMEVQLTLTEDILGSCPSDPYLHENYIASKAPDAWSKEEEIEALGTEAVVEKGKTIFSKDENGTPYLYDYQIRGFFKESCNALRTNKEYLSSKITAYTKEVDLRIFIKERRIPFENVTPMYDLQRPLRASTPMGERVALANSEAIRAGATLTFTVKCYNKEDLALVREWLDYGEDHGLGQWRSGGYGKFTWKELKTYEQ